MPLTPADVHNVAFSKPPIGKRGYNEDEVDAFLDLVENELTRLIEENSDLRQRINELDQELAAGGGAGVTPQATQAIPAYEPEPGKPAPAAVSARDERGTGPEGGASAESGPRHRRPAYKHRQSRVGQDAGRCPCQCGADPR